MRVYAAYDADGRIMALSEIVEDGERVTCVPLPPGVGPGDERREGAGGAGVVELVVPDGFEKRPLRELAEAFRVDAGSGSGEARFTAR
ncbi:hypothetical protein ACGFRB_00565 [Streptomyces sp. NPDC048718]|uniref:hypothetical protein n=1 Tax=Streptomyces sp. NPDC048718 TaxID=3365587 RepID=UPI003723132E